MEKYFQKLTSKGISAVRKLIIEIPFWHKSNRKHFFFCLAFLTALFILPGQTMAVNTDTSASVKPFEAPSDFAAVAISASRIDLSWSSVPDAVFYKVYRDGLLIVSLTATVYSDNGLTPGTPYSYTVSSVNIFGGESEQSSPVSAVFGFWTYEQTFDELASGDLNEQDFWSGDVDFDVGAAGALEGTKGVRATFNNTERSISRAVTLTANGTVYISMKMTTAGSLYQTFRLKDSSNAEALAIILGLGDNKIYYWDGGGSTWTQIDAWTFSDNTTVRFGIAFECGAGGWEGLAADTFKVSKDNGAWSAAMNLTAGRDNVAKMQIDLYTLDLSHYGYFDYISPNYEPIIVPPVSPPPSSPLPLSIVNEIGLEGGIFSPSAPQSSPSQSNSAQFQKIDTDKDGKIDMTDFNALMVNWGLVGQGNVADFNDDGVIDIFDFNLLMIYWTL